ncbi:MAG: beta-ketoacyl-[acyl-carrier-protein] synthase II [Chloroflexi bacterium]|nr:MAG: beta-ketoacyl-[acyl-carrier-protein] synthase II [Chloroflexota bacterium]
MRKRVVVTGLGCISPVGNDPSTLWNNLCSGKSGIGYITHFDTQGFECRIAAEVKDFDPSAIFGRGEARRMDRFTQFAAASAEQALTHSGLEVNDGNRDRIGAVIGSGIGGISTLLEQAQIFHERGPRRVSPFLVPMMLADTAPGTVAIRMGLHGPNLAVVTACATGTNTIGEATEMIRRGAADAVLAGGSEAAIVPVAIAGMSVMNALSTADEPQRACRPFDLNRSGFVMGEGAAILMLESLEFALERGATILAEVSGYAATNDAYHISAPAENGAGAAACMRNALENASLGVDDIDYINAHGTGTYLNDKSETAAIKTVFGKQAYNIPVSSTKSMTGHLLGGSGSLEALICVKVIQEKFLPPTINYETPDPECDLDYVPNTARPAVVKHIMSNSFGFGGHNATIILSRYDSNSTS